MAYATSVDDPSTSFSLATERFLCVSNRHMFAAVQIAPVLLRPVSCDSCPVGEFVDPPVFRSAVAQGAEGQLRHPCGQLEARS